MLIKRHYDKVMAQELRPGRVLVIYGPRRAGKTTLIKNFIPVSGFKCRYETGDDRVLCDVFKSDRLDALTKTFAQNEVLIIDEAQRVPNLGHGLKILVDGLPSLRVIASGSSSFEIAGQVGEPLTGRKSTLTLYPVSAGEMAQTYGRIELIRQYQDLMIYGSYPDIVTAPSYTAKVRALRELTNDYLFKDIIAFEGLRNSEKIRSLLTLIALQVGKQVSITELGTQLGMSKLTVERYLDLLQQTFILFKVSGFSRNLRTEVTKMSRYYFLDNGVLCSVLNNHTPLAQRSDAGMLWENWIVGERRKKNDYANTFMNQHFWRTYAQQEIDLVEEGSGKLRAFEIKWGDKQPKAPKSWCDAYPDAEYAVINRETFMEFVI